MITILLVPLLAALVAVLFGARRPSTVLLAFLGGIVITWLGITFWSPLFVRGEGSGGAVAIHVGISPIAIISVALGVVLVAVIVRKFFPPGRS